MQIVDGSFCDALRSGLHRSHGSPSDNANDLTDQTLGEFMNFTRQRFIGKIRTSGEREGRFKAIEKGEIVFVVAPSCNGLHVEPARHLSSGIDCIIHGDLSEEDGGNIVLTTDPPQESKNRFYILCPASERIVEFIEDQNSGL